MQNNPLWKKLLPVFFCVPAFDALGKEEVTYNWYMQGNLGLAQSRASDDDLNRQFQQAGLDAAVTAFDDADTGYGLALGYQWHDNWSIEAGLRNLGEFAIDITAEADDAQALYSTIENIHPESAKGIFAALNYRLLFGGNWSAAAKLGALSWRGDYDTTLIQPGEPPVGDEKQTGTDAFFGLGIAYRLTPRWEAGLGWEFYQFDNHDVDYLHLGLRYNFGEKNKSSGEKADAAAAAPPREIKKAQETAEVPLAPTPQLPVMNPEECQVFSGSLVGVNFNSGSAELTSAAGIHLQQAVDILKKYPQLTIEIQAHTDSLGEEAANLTLSIARADSVRDYFARQGIDAMRLIPQGFGEQVPLEDNDTPEGRATNRRLELKLRDTTVCPSGP
jgi:outer membrane protein OmpA-like peptidoglycan-associated protein